MSDMLSSVSHTPAFNIAGWVLVSFLDWPGRVSAILFAQGCNFRCRYCHNGDLLDSKPTGILLDDFVQELRSLDSWIDGAVMSGGEPCFQGSALIETCRTIKKELNLPIKLDTNGTYPEVVRELIGQGLVDMIALDVKAPFHCETYCSIAGVAPDPTVCDKIRSTLNEIQRWGRPYKVRTTVVRGFHTQLDILAIRDAIGCQTPYTLQDFKPEHALDTVLREHKGYGRDVLDSWLSSKTTSFLLTNYGKF